MRHHRPWRSGQKQTKYESETPETGLRIAVKASRIFVKDGASPHLRQFFVTRASPPRV